MKILAYFNNFFWLFSTYLLAPYLYFRIFLRKRKNAPLKILAIHTGKIGDLVCATSVFREIKKKFPSSLVTVIVISKSRDILRNNPHLDEIISINDYKTIRDRFRLLSKLRKEKYDWAFNFLPGSFHNIISFWSLVPDRAATLYRYSGEIVGLLSVFNNHRLEFKRHTSLEKHYANLLELIGIKEFSPKTEIFIRPEEEKKASSFLKENNVTADDFLIGISATAGIKFKEWEHDKFAVLADQLTAKIKAKVIFVGSPDDRPAIEKIQKMMKNNSINAAGAFKLQELAALMRNLKLFVSVDCGPLYVADAAGVPSVVIAGSVDMREQHPLNSIYRVVQKDIYCFPCSFTPFPARVCKEGHLRCLKEITPEEVLDSVVKLINEEKL
ncbi:MAG: glycosyltransferase family 9 protein [Candidatus Nealsonbacteria bacterium]